jgi:polyphosphate kinase
VTSVVGRFLEHERVYYFANSGQEELLIGSADMMLRNLDRRVEVLVPIKDPELRTAIRDDILNVSLRDNVKSWELCSDGSYRRHESGGGETLNSQEHMMTKGGAWRRG